MYPVCCVVAQGLWLGVRYARFCGLFDGGFSDYRSVLRLLQEHSVAFCGLRNSYDSLESPGEVLLISHIRKYFRLRSPMAFEEYSSPHWLFIVVVLLNNRKVLHSTQMP